MKNLFLLPTEDISRLAIFDKLLFDAEGFDPHVTDTQHLYITSDEDINEGVWCLDEDGITKCTAHAGVMNHYYSKIVLTTDPALIADGVQAIDDRFLQWYVDNPTCEFVEIEKQQYHTFVGMNKFPMIPHYKIIIPEEPIAQAKRMYTEEDMLKASEYGYNYHSTTSFPELCFEDSCKRNTQQWLTTFNRK